jgi:DNA-binding winged helix-turn-helix (wHTH) protein
VFHSTDALAATVIAVTTLGGVAAVSSILATDRFTERARRAEVEELVAHEARSSRVLAGLMRMANAKGDREVANALSDAIRAACHYPAAVSFVTRPSDGALVPIAWRLDSGEQPVAGQAVELPDSDTPGAQAARQGAALVIDGPAHLPAWARELGYVSGLVLPVTRGMDLLGIVYALRRQPSVTTVSEIEQLELVAAFASRMFSGSGSGYAPSAGMLDSLLGRRAHDQATAQPVISLPGVKLDPAREHTEIGGVSVSLSRTEFALLYALASNPGEAFEAAVLAQTCWEGDAPNDNAVDVTVYRLRRKLARVPAGQDLIQTVRGRGYMIQVPSADPVEATS